MTYHKAQSIDVVDVPVVMPRQVPMTQQVLKIVEIIQVPEQSVEVMKVDSAGAHLRADLGSVSDPGTRR